VPRFNDDKGSPNLVPNGCENCHFETLTGLAHPYGWLPGRGTTSPTVGGGKVANTTTHATFNFGAAGAYCSPCHTLSVSTDLPGSNAPSCMTQVAQIGGTTYCHFTASPVANPTGCASCHGSPPDGNAATGPNRAFRHTAHFSTSNNLGGITCSACHAGFGTGTITHATNVTLADTAVDPKFNEIPPPGTGAIATATYTPGTQVCTNVSCHGGKTLSTSATPPAISVLIKWKDPATIAFDQTTCTKCHANLYLIGANVLPINYSGPYIGPFSGDISASSSYPTYKNLHVFHATQITGMSASTPWLVCQKCHVIPVKNHFSKIMSGRRLLEDNIAAGTIGGSSITSYTGRVTVTDKSSCVAVCHNSPNAPYSWYNN
jgi:predicted CxxxxCH...CXXCH cytochrome family protein